MNCSICIKPFKSTDKKSLPPQSFDRWILRPSSQGMQLELPIPNHFFFDIKIIHSWQVNIKLCFASLNISYLTWIIPNIKQKWFGSANPTFVCCELNLKIHLSNDCGSRHFLSVDLNGLMQIEQFVVLLYFLHCYWVSHFIGILLVRCGLQMVTAARTWSKNFSVVSSPVFNWGGSKQASVEKT